MAPLEFLKSGYWYRPELTVKALRPYSSALAEPGEAEVQKIINSLQRSQDYFHGALL